MASPRAHQRESHRSPPGSPRDTRGHEVHRVPDREAPAGRSRGSVISCSVPNWVESMFDVRVRIQYATAWHRCVSLDIVLYSKWQS